MIIKSFFIRMIGDPDPAISNSRNNLFNVYFHRTYRYY